MHIHVLWLTHFKKLHFIHWRSLAGTRSSTHSIPSMSSYFFESRKLVEFRPGLIYFNCLERKEKKNTKNYNVHFMHGATIVDPHPLFTQQFNLPFCSPTSNILCVIDWRSVSQRNKSSVFHLIQFVFFCSQISIRMFRITKWSHHRRQLPVTVTSNQIQTIYYSALTNWGPQTANTLVFISFRFGFCTKHWNYIKNDAYI